MGLFKSPSTAGRVRPGQQNASNADLRGRISGPIPIDDEFPMRNPGTGIAHEGPPIRNVTPPERVSTVPSANTPPDVAREDRAVSMAPSGPSQVSYNTPSPQQKRTNHSSALRSSTVSDATNADGPQRKKSTLKSALGKLFGRSKKRNTRQASISEVHIGRPQNHHRSDPTALTRTVSPREGEAKRSVSLPITEFDRALRSHSVGPDDMMAINSARNSVQVDPNFMRVRAAATSSRVLNARIKVFGEEVIGLSPRPASAQGRDSRLGEEDPSDIGRAVTSDSFNNRRRSRSLSQLPNIVMDQQRTRNRNDEIRYWRESYDPGMLSPGLSNSNHDDTGMVDVETATVDLPAEIQPKTPPQPFNFGPIVNMKITQAASLEDRIAAMEVRNQKLEKVVSQLFQLLPGVNDYPESPKQAPPAAPRVSSSRYTSSSAAVQEPDYSTETQDFDPSTSRYSQSVESFGDGHTFIGSIPPSTMPNRRPTSTATVRGATSLPTLPRESSGVFTADHYTTLKALLDTERAARQALESQVTRLNHKVNVMSRASHKLNTNPPSSYSNISAFEHDDDDEEPLTASPDGDSEAFKTPYEERPSHFGAFGEELREKEEDGSRKKAARTLSLSQLTLGKPPKHSQHPQPAGVNL
ncbi:hypothetical protein F5Y15DRAFT_359565 [Xylariaceae sp. FL0016]|nr:hypothetical protein F5Y15DRAFT_359565 [Xylariaceae sp. FL0016]